MQTTTTTSEALPGLALRARLALARVQRKLNPDVAVAEFDSIFVEAQAMGYDAANRGECSPGALISEELLLCRAWYGGADKALMEMIQF